jgi:acyl-homoserine lactone synthase
MHIGTGFSQAMEHRLFRSMFEERKRVFVDLLRWDVPVIAGRYEIDQFDNDRAVYIVVTGDDGEHRASARLRRPRTSIFSARSSQISARKRRAAVQS